MDEYLLCASLCQHLNSESWYAPHRDRGLTWWILYVQPVYAIRTNLILEVGKTDVLHQAGEQPDRIMVFVKYPCRERDLHATT